MKKFFGSVPFVALLVLVAAGLLGNILSSTAQVLPQGAIPVGCTATGSTGAVTATCSVPTTGVINRTLFICGFAVSAIGGTAAVGPITVSNLLGGTQKWELASAAAGSQLNVSFNNGCMPATGPNTSVTIVTTADGTATEVDVTGWGYAQ